MMINPWLSDISGDYLDQPTDFINHHVIDVASHICKYAIYLCMVGKQRFLKEVGANRLHKVYIHYFSLPPNISHDVSTYRPRQNTTVDWFSW